MQTGLFEAEQPTHDLALDCYRALVQVSHFILLKYIKLSNLQRFFLFQDVIKIT